MLGSLVLIWVILSGNSSNVKPYIIIIISLLKFTPVEEKEQGMPCIHALMLI